MKEIAASPTWDGKEGENGKRELCELAAAGNV
jgi:hypothetical protein